MLALISIPTSDSELSEKYKKSERNSAVKWSSLPFSGVPQGVLLTLRLFLVYYGDGFILSGGIHPQFRQWALLLPVGLLLAYGQQNKKGGRKKKKRGEKPWACRKRGEKQRAAQRSAVELRGLEFTPFSGAPPRAHTLLTFRLLLIYNGEVFFSGAGSMLALISIPDPNFRLEFSPFSGVPPRGLTHPSAALGLQWKRLSSQGQPPTPPLISFSIFATRPSCCPAGSSVPGGQQKKRGKGGHNLSTIPSPFQLCHLAQLLPGQVPPCLPAAKTKEKRGGTIRSTDTASGTRGAQQGGRRGRRQQGRRGNCTAQRSEE